MFRAFSPILRRNLPQIFKLSSFVIGFFILNHHAKVTSPVQCIHLPSFSQPHNIFAEVLPKIVRIQQNGVIIGFAYCFNERMLVTPSHELLDRKQKKMKYEFFIGDKKLQTNFKIIGNFQNLTFIEAQHSILPVLPAKDADLYTLVHVVQNRSQLSIQDGYYVANQSGFGVVNSRGQVGSLVLNGFGVVGIVTHIGRDADDGFLRIILWKDIKNAVNRIRKYKQSSIYLGMSVVSNSGANEGLSVVRLTPNSPLSQHIQMGDVIKSVNGHRIRNPDDLTRLIMLSDGKVEFEIEKSDKSRKLIDIEL